MSKEESDEYWRGFNDGYEAGWEEGIASVSSDYREDNT